MSEDLFHQRRRRSYLIAPEGRRRVRGRPERERLREGLLPRGKADKGVRVMVKGRPKTEEAAPLAALKESVNKAAYAYTDKHVGPKEEVGNKDDSLSNRLRAVPNA